MTNEVGMFKPVLPQAAQTSPTAPVERAQRPAAVGQGLERAKEAEKAEEANESIDGVVSDLNKLVRDLQRELQFSVDRESGETVIKVVDRETDEVLRQIPSDEVMRLRKRLEEAAGVIFHDSA